MIKCKETIELRKEFIEKLLVELIKQKMDNVDMNMIIVFYEDILRYLEEEEEEYETNQQYIEISKIFRGFIVKDWKGADFNCNKYRALNKILIFNAVQFYRKCWQH